MAKDYYIVLGLSRGADLNRIKRAYRSLAKQLHPDTTRTEETTDRFIEAKEAYETLGDAEKRRRYDEELSRGGLRVKVARVREGIRDRRSGFDRMNSFFTDTDDFFSGLVPGFFDLHRGRSGGKDLYFEAVLSPEEAAEGGLYPISVPVFERCPRCTGSGAWEEFFCPLCRGYGRVQAEREFSLSIPPHVRDGTRVTVSMEDIGLKGANLHIVVTVDHDLR